MRGLAAWRASTPGAASPEAHVLLAASLQAMFQLTVAATQNGAPPVYMRPSKAIDRFIAISASSESASRSVYAQTRCTQPLYYYNGLAELNVGGLAKLLAGPGVLGIFIWATRDARCEVQSLAPPVRRRGSDSRANRPRGQQDRSRALTRRACSSHAGSEPKPPSPPPPPRSRRSPSRLPSRRP